MKLSQLQQQIVSEAVELFDDYLDDGKRLFTGGRVNFTEEEWRQECKDYLKEKLHQATQRVAEITIAETGLSRNDYHETYPETAAAENKAALAWLNHNSEEGK